MKIETIKTKAYPDSSEITFNFSDTVDQYMIGASQISYEFTSKDHHVKKIKLGIAPSVSGKNVIANISMILNDNSTHEIASSSYVNVLCLAATGQNSDKYVQLKNNISFSSGSKKSIQLKQKIYDNMPIMQGFSMEYDKNDHHIKQLKAELSISHNNSTTDMTGICGMEDKSGHSSISNELQTSYLGTSLKGNSSGLVLIEKTYETDEKTTTIDLSGYLGEKKLTAAAVLIKSFELAFSTDHHMKRLRVGASKVSFEGQSIRFTPRASMTDGSKHNALGVVTLIIIGVCNSD